MKKELPFAPTPVIKRYLQVMVNVITTSDKYGQIHNGKIKNPITIGAYDDDEMIFPDSEKNRINFLEYLKTEKAIRESEGDFEHTQDFRYPDGQGPKLGEDGATAIKRGVFFPSAFTIQILDAQKVVDLQKRVALENVESQIGDINWNNKTGKFCFRGIEHDFQTKRGGGIVIKIFDVLWENKKVISNRPQTGATKTYFDIAKDIHGANSPEIPKTVEILHAKLKTIRRIEAKKIPIKVHEEKGYVQMIVTM